jgi:glycosyltransferase involved in cell wall biosynthesis
VIPLPEHGRGTAAKTARNVSRLARRTPPLVDRFAGFERQIETAIAGQRYGAGVVEHFWCAPYLPVVEAACERTVLDLHNVESALHERCAESERAPTSFAHRLFASASLELEREWLPRYDTVLAPSESDAERVRGIAPSAHVAIYPNAIPDAAERPRAEENAIAFSGNLEYHPNVGAVRYFSREIWPGIRRRWPDLVWRLIGKNPESVVRYVYGDPRIQITGRVPDAIAELTRVKAVVVPLLAGSGTRFKILEAWAAGTAVVSTPLGAEGLPAVDGGNLLLAETTAQWVEAVSRLLSCPSLARTLAHNGRNALEAGFTWQAAWDRLDL